MVVTLEEVKRELRVSHVEHDAEIVRLIASAESDLRFAGLVLGLTPDATVLEDSAVVAYCKAYFGYDNPDGERFAELYEARKKQLTSHQKPDTRPRIRFL